MCSTSSMCLNTLRPDKKWRRAPPRRSPKLGEHGQVVGVTGRLLPCVGKLPEGRDVPAETLALGFRPTRAGSPAQHSITPAPHVNAWGLLPFSLHFILQHWFQTTQSFARILEGKRNEKKKKLDK